MTLEELHAKLYIAYAAHSPNGNDAHFNNAYEDATKAAKYYEDRTKSYVIIPEPEPTKPEAPEAKRGPGRPPKKF